jgi:hypothetical protein
MSVSDPELASVPCTALARDLRWSVRQRTAGAPRGARHVVKSDAVPGSDCSPVCSGLVSIAEVGECRRARSSTPLVAADGGIERAKPVRDESLAAVTRRRSAAEGVLSSH